MRVYVHRQVVVEGLSYRGACFGGECQVTTKHVGSCGVCFIHD